MTARTYTAAEVAAAVEEMRRELDALRKERSNALECIPIDILRSVDAPGATGITSQTPLVDAVRKMTDMGRRLLTERAEVRREARRKALEEAAQIAERVVNSITAAEPGFLNAREVQTAFRACAAAIRALIEELRDAG